MDDHVLHIGIIIDAGIDDENNLNLGVELMNADHYVREKRPIADIIKNKIEGEVVYTDIVDINGRQTGFASKKDQKDFVKVLTKFEKEVAKACKGAKEVAMAMPVNSLKRQREIRKNRKNRLNIAASARELLEMEQADE